MTISKLFVLTTLAAVLPAAPAFGDTIPYMNIGTPFAAGVDFYALGGPVKAYFFGSDAMFDSVLFLDLPSAIGPVLPNHSSSRGQEYDFGSFAPGTLLRFRLYVSHGDGTFESFYTGIPPAPNGDTEVHAYVTPWGGGMIPGSAVSVPGPAFYVGWEDIHGANSDWDYNDHQFLLANVGLEAPEPSTLILFGSTGLALGLLRRKART